MKSSPQGDHQANGMAESGVRECKGQTRAVRSQLESHYGVRFGEKEPILAWAPRHAANCIDRYRIGSDGKTPERRRTGRIWKRPTCMFGEVVFFRKAGPAPKGAADRMIRGVFVGHHERTGGQLMLTPAGLMRGVGIHQLPESQRWDLKFLRECKGLPWDTVPKQREAEAPFAGEGDEDKSAPIRLLPAQEVMRKKMYVLKSDVSRFGPTPGCKGCV